MCSCRSARRIGIRDLALITDRELNSSVFLTKRIQKDKLNLPKRKNSTLHHLRYNLLCETTKRISTAINYSIKIIVFYYNFLLSDIMYSGDTGVGEGTQRHRHLMQERVGVGKVDLRIQPQMQKREPEVGI